MNEIVTIEPDKLTPLQGQIMAVPDAFDLALLGGRGYGKTRVAILIALRFCEQYGKHAKALIVRRSFPGLGEIEQECLTIFSQIYGTSFSYNSQKHRFKMPNGGTISLDQLDHENDFGKFQGRSFGLIIADEAGQYPSPNLLDRLRSSLRAPLGIPTRYIITANPGGPGHGWIKKRHVLRPEWEPYTDDNTGISFVTVNGTYESNIFIDREKYARNLRASNAADPALVQAWLSGDWTAISGAFFECLTDKSMFDPWQTLPGGVGIEYHTDFMHQGEVKSRHEWKFFLAGDYGYAAPSVFLAMAESPGREHEGRFYPRGSKIVFDEVALAGIDDPSQGLFMIAPEQAAAIKSMTDKWGIRADGVIDDACFANLGSQDGTIADQFRKAGVHFRKAHKGSRASGWNILRTLMTQAGQPDVPGLYIGKNCQYLWETLPSLPRDPRNPEDLDTRANDHGADGLRYGCLRRAPILTTGIGYASAR